MAAITDSEFGPVTIRRHARASQVRVRVAPHGQLVVSAPPYVPVFMIKRVIGSSRDELRRLLQTQRPDFDYRDGSTIGKSHHLAVRPGSSLRVDRHGLQISLSLPPEMTLDDSDAQDILRPAIIAALRREAKSYLPKRLRYLADQAGFDYARVRFSHAAGRWGSCSSTGTISLNIALMRLPFELIDYVLIHELAHTRHMNHSRDFWATVALHDPHYTHHRALLKQETPTV